MSLRALFALFAVSALLDSAAVAEARRPNVVYFIIDELGYYELSSMGHPEHKTPNIDRLMADGMRFTQCLAGGPVCAPTRCALLTGKHAGHMTVRANGGFDPLLPGEPTLGSMFKDAGYATGGFGKWGNGGRGTSGVPEKHGFDIFFGYYDQVHAHTFFPKYLIRNSEEVPLPGNTGDTKVGQTFSQYVIFDEAKKFIRENKNKPFFAYCCFTPPHGQWGFPNDDPAWQLFKNRPYQLNDKMLEDARMYAAMVNLVDREVGETRALLEELGLADDTILVFSGDNGANKYFPSADYLEGVFSPNVNPKTGVKFRGFKGQLYDGGLHVPFAVCWPKKIPAGKVSDHLCYFPDVMPTLAELTGAPLPADRDGLSFAPTLLAEAASGREQPQHKYLYWEHQKDRAVRSGKWKAIQVGGPNKPWELYDVATDVSEEHDVAAEHSDVLEKLKAYAEEAHTPVVAGEVYDRALVEKDRHYKEGMKLKPASGENGGKKKKRAS
ncbi:MAG: arylsulfatase [Planctomycetaceae bacterium]|nr:arylsulfatase [Planctomycetaceae bacterium]